MNVKTAKILLVISAVLLGAGVSMPCLRITPSLTGNFDSVISAVTGSDFNKPQEKSVIDILGMLLSDRELFLFGLILIFSVLFPTAKIALYLLSARSLEQPGLNMDSVLKITDKVSKFSMTDVFVISLLLVSLKSSPNIKVEVMAGTYFFAASVLVTFVAQLIISKLKPSGHLAHLVER
ncbi:MAG: paraquat-inducible protein A [Akkermansiaceae bacterium]|nr:paraquat-inducible protein A [Akkermansiaceae bacterium]